MAVDHVKSAQIINFDAKPAVYAAAGEGGPFHLVWVDGFVTAIAASSIDATYQITRVPTTAKVKSVVLESEAQGAGAFDIGVYRSTDGVGGQPTALLAAAAVNRALFGSAISLAALVVPIDVTNESTTYTLDKRIQPLWQAAGLTADPGGYFDIVMTVTTTAVTTGTGKMGLRVAYAL